MYLRHVVNVVGLLLIILALTMLPAAGVALTYGDGDAEAIAASAALTLLAGVALHGFTRFEGDVTIREGYAIVTLAWCATATFGALPYLLSGALDSPAAALFESMSGFTTTGATVFADVEALSHGVLFWRSLTHWLGGMGIIVLAVAILPFLGVGGMQLFRAEVPGPTPERLRPRIAQTAKFLWLVYVAMTLLQVMFYVGGGMGVFDAVTHTFGTVATGGFSTRNASMAAFSPYAQYVTIVFMYLAGLNFTLHFRAATGRFAYWRDEEWRFFTLLILLASALVLALTLSSGAYPLTGVGLERAARDALFTVTSIITTTGFVTADYELWVPAAQVSLLLLMFVGGMAGSTGGGMKAVRVLLVLKQTGVELRKQLHPRAVLLTRVGGRAVKEDVLANVVGFVILYVLAFVGGTLAMSLFGMDLATAVGASATTLGNVGPGLADVGPLDNFGWVSSPALGILTLLMLVGRLEIYTVLLLLHPETWKRRKAFR